MDHERHKVHRETFSDAMQSIKSRLKAVLFLSVVSLINNSSFFYGCGRGYYEIKMIRLCPT